MRHQTEFELSLSTLGMKLFFANLLKGIIYNHILIIISLDEILNISFMLKLLFKKAKYISVFGNVVNDLIHFDF